jgi:hypothetical protein
MAADLLYALISDLLKTILVEGIMGNLGGLFNNVNSQVGEIAAQIGATPAAWNGAVFSLIRNLSETVALPVAGLLLTFVMTWELIQLILEKNNLHEIDTWLFFKWFFKTAVAVTLLSNTFNIVMAVFDVSGSVINSAAGIISNSTAVTPSISASFRDQLMAMDTGSLLGLYMQSTFIGIIVVALNICIFCIIHGRMLEIYLITSLAPLPMATLTSREMGGMGQNYLKSLLAVGFQGLLIMVCVAIYAVLVQSIATSGDPINMVWTCIGYATLLCFMLFKTGTIAKSVFGSH